MSGDVKPVFATFKNVSPIFVLSSLPSLFKVAVSNNSGRALPHDAADAASDAFAKKALSKVIVAPFSA